MEKNDKISPKEIYESLWRCRDFELSHLWQRSIFLTAFLVMCFTAYGAVLIEVVEKNTNFIASNLLAFVISIAGLIFSCLWIMMAKGSKAWYELYENAISAFSNVELYYVDNDTSKISGFKYNEISGYKYPEIKKNIISGKGGAYSPSRINIAIGQVMLVIWIITLLLHTTLIIWGTKVVFSPCFKYIILSGGFLILILFFVLVFVPKIHWLHSDTLSDK